MTYIRTLKDGKSQVMKELAFSTLLGNKLPDDTKNFIELILGFDKEIATHSIRTVHNIPQPAVDEVYEVNSLQQGEIAFANCKFCYAA